MKNEMKKIFEDEQLTKEQKMTLYSLKGTNMLSLLLIILGAVTFTLGFVSFIFALCMIIGG